MSALHVVPVGDLIEHDTTEDCICGPVAKLYEELEDGGDAWILTHSSLDGREFYQERPKHEIVEGGPFVAFKPFKKGNKSGTKKKKSKNKKGIPASLLNSKSPKTPGKKGRKGRKKK